MLAVLGVFALQLRAGLAVQSDLLALMPKDNRDPIVEASTERFMREVSQRVAVLISGNQPAQAARACERMLRESGLFSRVLGELGSDFVSDYQAIYFPHRDALVPGRLLDELAGPDGPARAARRVGEILSSPLSGGLTSTLGDDPLLLFPAFLDSLPRPPGKLEPIDGFLGVRIDGREHLLVSAVLGENVFSRAAQQRASRELEIVFERLALQYPESTIRHLGALRFAKAMAEEAERDISRIGLGSMVATSLLVLATFLSAAPLLMSMLTVAIGIVFSVVLCQLVFGEVHVLTLGFGASLIGVCSDYSFHYFCHRYLTPGESSRDTVRAIMPGITIGVLTSVLGYLGLLIVPFPGLNQMAFFAVVGMLVSYACVVLWFPMLGRAPARREPLLLRLSHAWLAWAGDPRTRRLARFVALPLVPALLWAGTLARSNDDVRLLQRPPRALQEEERSFREILGGMDGSRFFVVHGQSEEETLQRVERLTNGLEALEAKGALAGFQSMASFVPSARSQSERFARLSALLKERERELRSALTGLGMSEEVLNALYARLSSPPPAPLVLADWKKGQAAALAEHLWLGRVEGRYVALVPLAGLSDFQAAAALADRADSIQYVDLVSDASGLLGRFRTNAALLVGICYLAVFLFMAVRYGPALAFSGMVPAITSVLATLAFHGLSGEPVTLFSVLANVIVLGLAIDYSVFLLEGMDAEGPTMMAIVLSALSTILAFGLLALSVTPVLRSFGLSLFIGVVVAMSISSIVVRPRTRET